LLSIVNFAILAKQRYSVPQTCDAHTHWIMS